MGILTDDRESCMYECIIYNWWGKRLSIAVKWSKTLKISSTL